MPNYPAFDVWEEYYNSDQLDSFNGNQHGLLWLKIKSIIRRELLEQFTTEQSLTLHNSSLSKQFIELYDILKCNPTNSHIKLDEFMKRQYKKKASSIDVKTTEAELYKLRYFNWRGDYKNALDKYLNDFKNKKVDDLQITFQYKKKPQVFSAISDVIFIVK